MRVEEITKLFKLVPNKKNLYHSRSEFDTKEISYPSDAFGNTDSDNKGFWAQARLVAIKKAMSSNGASQIVEVGAGGGAVCVALAHDNFTVFAIEPHWNGANAIANSGVPVLVGFLNEANFPDECIPNYGTFDVLEHLTEPAEMLRKMHRTLNADGRLYLTVPVGQWLWGSLDETLGHQRRFSKRSMRQLLERNGFVPEQEEYLFLSLVPFAWLTRALPWKFRRSNNSVEEISNQLAPNKLVNSLSAFILKIEAKISQLIPLPYGLTLMVVAKKA
jgi:SAM-dependent methyltransferase